MASMFMMKNTILRVSKAGFCPQLPSFYPPKVSRVCFTSSSKNLNQYAREDAGGEEDAKAAERLREARQVYENDREAEEVEKKYNEMKQKAGDTAQNMKQKAQEGAQQATDAMQEAKDRAKDSADKARRKAGDTAQTVKEKAQEGAQTMKKKAQEGAEQASEAMREAKDKAKDSAGWTADRAKEGTGKVAETVHNVGEKAKETAKGAWESAKGATQKIKETVVGKDTSDEEDDYRRRIDEFVEDHTTPPPRGPTSGSGDSRDRYLHRDGP